MELEAEIQKCRRAIEKAEASQNWAKQSKKLEDFGNVNMQRGLTLALKLDVEAADACFSEANEALKKALEILRRLWLVADKSTQKRRMQSRMHQLEKGINASQGFMHYNSGSMSIAKRNPGDAIKHFEEAEQIFKGLYERTKEDFPAFFADYCRGLIFGAQATESELRGDFRNAAAGFQRAQMAMKRLLESAPDEIKALMMLPHRTYEGAYYYYAAKDEFTGGNFALAREHAEKACSSSEEVIIMLPEGSSEQFKNLLLGIHYTNLGFCHLANGEAPREQGRWDEAIEGYKEAKAAWEKGAGYCFSSELLGAVALQEYLINYAAQEVPAYIRRCRREQQLQSEVKELEAEISDFQRCLMEAVKPAGVTVTTTQEMISTVTTTVQINQVIENNIRASIKDLLAELQGLEIDASKRQQIQNEAQGVLEEHGEGFWERAKKFAKNISDLAKELGDRAAPIMPLVTALSLILQHR